MTSKPDRRSQISRHPERLSIELASLGGMSLERVADRFGVHRDAIWRHMRSLKPEYRAMLVAEVPLAELAERAAAEGQSLLDNLGILRSGLMQAALAARANGDHHAHASLARVALEVLREAGKLNGEILQTPSIANVTHNTTIFMQSPAFLRLEAMLMERLAPHPEALRAVVEGLEDLQGSTLAPVPALEGVYAPSG